MEQESSKIPPSRSCFKWERIHTLLCFVVVTCLLTCIAFQFIFLVSMHRKLEDVETQLRGKESRLATIESELRVIQDKERKPRSQWEGRLTIAENKIEAISQTLKHGKWEQTKNHARQKRTTNPQVNLSDLGKRVIAVESRYYCKLLIQFFVLAPWVPNGRLFSWVKFSSMSLGNYLLSA